LEAAQVRKEEAVKHYFRLRCIAQSLLQQAPASGVETDMHYTTTVVSSIEIDPGQAGYHQTAHHATSKILTLYNEEKFVCCFGKVTPSFPPAQSMI
jgi:hypothetical protein